MFFREDYIKCFLLIPKYSEKDFKRNNSTGCYDSRFLLSEKYKIITYRDIFNDFFKNATVNNPQINNYLTDFKSALVSLANEVNNEFEEEMKYRFGKTIGEIK